MSVSHAGTVCAAACAPLTGALRCDSRTIRIGFYMITTKIDDVYEVELPPEVKAILSVCSTMVSFGFSSIGSVLECLGMRGYVPELTVYMVTPAVIALVVLLVGIARVRCHDAAEHTATSLFEKTAPSTLNVIFLAYPLVTNVAFEAFSCYQFSESSWLKADVSIECDTAKHDRVRVLAWVAIVLYPIGLIVLNGSLLFMARRAILKERPSVLSRGISVLHREYGACLCFLLPLQPSRGCLPQTTPPYPPP